MPTEDTLKDQLKTLGAVLDERARQHQVVEAYYEGASPYPMAVQAANMTRAYRYLMPMAEAPWGSLVVDSVLDRLEVAGVRSEDKSIDDQVWGAWQDNGMDAESKIGHNSALLDGRVFALVWPDTETKQPEITLDDSTQMVVQYREGSRRKREAAMRRWQDGDVMKATLYRPDGIWKFQSQRTWTPGSELNWERRAVEKEDWPLKNPLEVVPVVEVAVNRRLKPGAFGHARGEYEHCVGLLDRINLLTFIGLVVAIWMGFPLRGTIGTKVLRDDDENPIAPIDADPGSVFSIENPEAKTAEFAAADRKNLSVFAELDQLAVVTKTPRHYFPLEQGMSNLSADAIRASEGGLHAKVTGHKASLGEGWEEVLRLSGMMLDEGKELSPRAELLWRDHESRSLAERADAVSKLKDTLPWQATAEIALNATEEQLNRWKSQRTGDAFDQLLSAAQQPVAPQNGTAPVAEPVS